MVRICVVIIRMRNVQNEPGVGGRPCGPRKESRMCTLADCS